MYNVLTSQNLRNTFLCPTKVANIEREKHPSKKNT